MEHLISNAITYWYITALCVFVVGLFLQHRWRNRITNTSNAVKEYEKLFARFTLLNHRFNDDLSTLSTAIDSTVKFHSAVNFPNREVQLVMGSLKSLRKSARAFHWFWCRYRLIIGYAPSLFDDQVIHDKLAMAERRSSHAMTLLNQKLNY